MGKAAKAAKAGSGAGDSASSAIIIRSVRESALWVLGALALIMLLALLTYDPRDPGFSNTGEGGELHNQIGSVGAWFADIAYNIFAKYRHPLSYLLTGKKRCIPCEIKGENKGEKVDV